MERSGRGIEMPKFAEGTRAIAEAIVKATEKGAFSLIGGGDSVAATTSSDWPTRSATYLPVEVPFSNTSKEKNYPESLLSAENNRDFDKINERPLKCGRFFLCH